MPRRKICVVTGSRAEYGLMRRLMELIRSDASLQLQVVATGSHFSEEFGFTYKEIEKDGFQIDSKVNMRLSADTPPAVCKALGRAVIGFAAALPSLTPDILVIAGDRYEILAATESALILGIPVAHISGGECTEGAIDDSIRHSLTKMSHIHFAATEEYRERIIQLGEDPRRVFNVGDLGVESVQRIRLLSKAEWAQKTGFVLGSPNIAVVFHPATAEAASPRDQFNELLRALERLPRGAKIVFTRSNADAGGRQINSMIDSFVSRNREHSAVFASLGQLLYLSLLKNSDVLIGNSSSGITEAPALRIPTINIGDRQKGRLMASSIINCRPREATIRAALGRALTLDCSIVRHPYEGGDASGKIVKILRSVELEGILKKTFFDLPRRRGRGNPG